MRKYTRSDYKRVLRLRKQTGWGNRRISKALGIPRDRVYAWIHKDAKPIPISEKIRKHMHILPESAKRLSPELGYVIGAWKGDGCIQIRKDGASVITLGAKDLDFVETFKQNIEKWSGIKGSEIQKLDAKRYANGYYIYRLCSKQVCVFLRDFNLNLLLTTDDDIKGMFLRGFFDAEGDAGFSRKHTHRRVRVGNTDKSLMILCRKLLKSLGIETQTWKETKFTKSILGRPVNKYTTMYRLRVKGSKEQYIKFRDKVGFSIERKREKVNQIIDTYVVEIWTENELNFLKKNHEIMTSYEIAEKLNKTRDKVIYQMEKMNLSGYRAWRDSDIVFLKKNFLKMSDRQIGKILGKTKSGVMHKRLRINLKKSRKWSDEEIKNELRTVSEQIEYLSYSYLEKNNLALLGACITHFGGFNNAKIASGLPIKLKNGGELIYARTSV